MKPYTYRRKNSFLRRKWEIMYEGQPVYLISNVSAVFMDLLVAMQNEAYEVGQLDERAKHGWKK